MDTTARLYTLIAGGFLSGCEPAFDPSRLTQGPELYSYYCQSCHVQQGLGPALIHMPAKADDLKAHEIVLIIKYGYSDEHPNPSFSSLSDEQAVAIADFIVRQRQKGVGDAPSPDL